MLSRWSRPLIVLIAVFFLLAGCSSGSVASEPVGELASVDDASSAADAAPDAAISGPPNDARVGESGSVHKARVRSEREAAEIVWAFENQFNQYDNDGMNSGDFKLDLLIPAFDSFARSELLTVDVPAVHDCLLQITTEAGFFEEIGTEGWSVERTAEVVDVTTLDQGVWVVTTEARVRERGVDVGRLPPARYLVSTDGMLGTPTAPNEELFCIDANLTYTAQGAQVLEKANDRYFNQGG